MPQNPRERAIPPFANGESFVMSCSLDISKLQLTTFAAVPCQELERASPQRLPVDDSDFTTDTWLDSDRVRWSEG